MNIVRASIFLLIGMLGTRVLGQQSNPRSVVTETNRQEMDTLLLRKPIVTSEDKSARQAVLKQINDDFKALQVLENKVMSAVTAPGNIDYGSLANLMSDIGSKASRLKTNLVLPKAESEKKEKVSDETSEASDFRNRLILFDKVVVNFATNPIFQKANVVEIDLAKQASKDLATIIERSSDLKKSATKLAKKH